MQVTILTLQFDPATGGFRTEPLDSLSRRSKILRVRPAFFKHQETPCWTLVVTHCLRAAAEEAGARSGRNPDRERGSRSGAAGRVHNWLARLKKRGRALLDQAWRHAG